MLVFQFIYEYIYLALNNTSILTVLVNCSGVGKMFQLGWGLGINAQNRFQPRQKFTLIFLVQYQLFYIFCVQENKYSHLKNDLELIACIYLHRISPRLASLSWLYTHTFGVNSRREFVPSPTRDYGSIGDKHICFLLCGFWFATR